MKLREHSAVAAVPADEGVSEVAAQLPPEVGFRVEQDAFQGTLGELAYALRTYALLPNQLDLYKLVRDYLAYFEALADRDLLLASEALPAVAQVIELKVRLLLPRPPATPEDEEIALEEALDAVALLEELELAVAFLRERREERKVVMPARAPKPDLPRPERPLDIDARQLAQLAARFSSKSYFELSVERLTQAVAMRRLMAALKRTGRGLLRQLSQARDWATATVMFVAMLELVRQGRVAANQDEPYGEIELELRSERVRDVA